MAAPSAVNIHGTTDTYNDIVDESTLDIEDFKFKVSREKRERKNRHGNVRRIEAFNPMVAISFTAMLIGAPSGLADQHPGTRVTALVNYAVEQRGFDPAVGTMILDDAEDSLSQEDDRKTSVNVTHYPFVVTA